MPNMENMAFTQQKKLFDRLASVASYAALSDEDRMAYEADLKAYRDMTGQLEFAKAKGLKEGRKEGEARMIREMARQGISLDLISSVAKIPVEEVKRILDSKDQNWY